MKKNWVSLVAIALSIAAICVSVVRCEPFIFKDSALVWIIGISISVINAGIVAILGFQIYNSISIDKKVKGAFDERIKYIDEKIEKTKEELAISGVMATSATLYRAEGVNLKLSMGIKDYESMIRTLSQMLEYAILLKDSTLSDIARLIVNSKNIIINQWAVKDDHVRNGLLCLLKAVLPYLPSSDEQVPQVYQAIKDLEN